MEPTDTQSPDRTEFDELCADIDEFEPLPAVKAENLERDEENDDDTSLDGQILAGLVSPV